MTPAEAATLLAVAAAFDNRKADPDAATAWAIALDGLDFTDCRDAIVAHYRVSNGWIGVADIITAVKRKRGSRIAAELPIVTPPGFDPDDTAAYRELLIAQRERAAAGQVTAEGMKAIEGPRVPIPDTSNLLRAIEPMRVKPTKRDPEYRARRRAAEAELESLRQSLAHEPEAAVVADESEGAA